MSTVSPRAAVSTEMVDRAVEFTAGIWGFYRRMMADDPPLLNAMIAFSNYASEMLDRQFSTLRGMPGRTLAMIVARAVVRSGTHTRAEVEAAIGALLPE